MGEEYPLGAGVADGVVQPAPVDVIGHHKAAIRGPPPAHPAQPHPARGDGGRGRPEAPRPGRAQRAGRGQHQRAGMVAQAAVRGHAACGRQRRQPLCAQNLCDVFHGAMGQDRPGPGIEHRQHALRLDQRIGAQHRGPARRGVRRPPGIDLFGHRRRRRPGGDRRPEGVFADEGVAAQWLERRRQAVGIALVVARDDPDLARHVDPDLRRAGHMSRGVKADARAPQLPHLAIGDGIQRDVAQT